ncbi:tyrosine-type recombinase/integrase, partial [Lentilactobacillus hilgardii]
TSGKQHNTNKGQKLNVQPIRKPEDINMVEWFLSRNKMVKRDKLLFQFGINTGLKASDIITRKVGELRRALNPYIIDEKTHKRRHLNLTMLEKKIGSYFSDKNDDDWLFTSYKNRSKHITVNGVYQILQKLRKEMGKPCFVTHTLRKKFGHHYYKRTHDIATLMKIFNYSSQKIIKRYIGVTDDEINQLQNNFRLG